MQAGGPSPFGTVAQADNIWEWEETELGLMNNSPEAIRGIRGSDTVLTITDLALSSSFRNRSLPWRPLNNVGFRVASIPEPVSNMSAKPKSSSKPITATNRPGKSVPVCSSCSASPSLIPTPNLLG